MKGSLGSWLDQEGFQVSTLRSPPRSGLRGRQAGVLGLRKASPTGRRSGLALATAWHLSSRLLNGNSQAPNSPPDFEESVCRVKQREPHASCNAWGLPTPSPGCPLPGHPPSGKWVLQGWGGSELCPEASLAQGPKGFKPMQLPGHQTSLPGGRGAGTPRSWWPVTSVRSLVCGTL